MTHMFLCDFIFNAKEVLGFGIALPSFTASVGAFTPLKQIFVKLGPGQPPWIDGFLDTLDRGKDVFHGIRKKPRKRRKNKIP